VHEKAHDHQTLWFFIAFWLFHAEILVEKVKKFKCGDRKTKKNSKLKNSLNSSQSFIDVDCKSN